MTQRPPEGGDDNALRANGLAAVPPRPASVTLAEYKWVSFRGRRGVGGRAGECAIGGVLSGADAADHAEGVAVDFLVFARSPLANSWRQARNPTEWTRNSPGLRNRATPAKRDVIDTAVRSSNRNNYRIAHHDARRASTGAATGAGRHAAAKSRSGPAR